MQIKPLYRYTDEHGRTVVSPDMPENVSYTTAYRLIADEGMGLTRDGVHYTGCVDVDRVEGWREETHSFDDGENTDVSDAVEAALDEAMEILSGEV